MFRSSAFEQGLPPADFPALPEEIEGALPSLGANPLLSFALKHFGFACADREHPVHADLSYNFEREWAWSLGNALMTELRVTTRAFVQTPEVLAFLGRVAPGLPAVPLHPLEEGFQHVMWSFSSLLELMQRAC